MAEEIDFENGRISKFQWHVTLTLDRAIWHTILHHSSTSTYTPNFIQIRETLCTYARIMGGLATKRNGGPSNSPILEGPRYPRKGPTTMLTNSSDHIKLIFPSHVVGANITQIKLSCLRLHPSQWKHNINNDVCIVVSAHRGHQALQFSQS